MDKKPILRCAQTRPSRYRVPWWLSIVWIAISALVWRKTDWWAYVREGGGAPDWPKFETPLWFQLSASLLLGLLATALVFVALVVLRRIRRGT